MRQAWLVGGQIQHQNSPPFIACQPCAVSTIICQRIHCFALGLSQIVPLSSLSQEFHWCSINVSLLCRAKCRSITNQQRPEQQMLQKLAMPAMTSTSHHAYCSAHHGCPQFSASVDLSRCHNKLGSTEMPVVEGFTHVRSVACASAYLPTWQHTKCNDSWSQNLAAPGLALKCCFTKS